MAIQVDPKQIMEDGYIILRNVIPPNRLDGLRAAFETLVDRQREVWASERKPDDPPGGLWDTGKQPRLHFQKNVDPSTSDAIEFVMGENTLGVAKQLIRGQDIGLHAMFMMCNPRRDYGPDRWHRDTGPAWDSPLQGLELDMQANGPGYVQWNVPLYDDNVLWVVPGSHKRANTPEENAQLVADATKPLPGGIPVELKAGDGVVYTNFILHWGSNYSAKMRRTIHFAHQSFGGPLHRYFHIWWDPSFFDSLPDTLRPTWEAWTRSKLREHDVIEKVYRTILAGNAPAFRSALAELHPGETGRMVAVILLGKIAQKIYAITHPDSASSEWGPSSSSVPGSRFWFDDMAQRFTTAEIERLWERYGVLDENLKSEEPQIIAGTQSQPTPYRVYEMPPNFDVEDFIASWHARVEVASSPT